MNAYICDVCQKPFIWNEDSASLLMPTRGGHQGTEFHFLSCSEECRKKENLKEPLLKWMEEKNIAQIARDHKIKLFGLK